MTFLAFAEGAPMIQLLPDASVLIHIALILLMIYVLNRTFFSPVNRVLRARMKYQGGSSEAQEILRSVGEKRAHYELAMREARNQGYQIIESERAEAISRRETELEQTKEEVASKFDTEKQELQHQTATVRQQIEQEADMMAEKISRSILNVN